MTIGRLGLTYLIVNAFKFIYIPARLEAAKRPIKESGVSLFMLFLNLSHTFEETGNFGKPFLTSYSLKPGIHLRPFLVLTISGGFQVRLGITYSSKKVKLPFSVHPFVFGGL